MQVLCGIFLAQTFKMNRAVPEICFGTGTALFYPIPCAKAWNSALPNSRIESRFSPKLCVALATVQPCLIHCLMPKPVKAGFYKALFRFGHVEPGFVFQTQAPVKSQAHKAGFNKKAPC